MKDKELFEEIEIVLCAFRAEFIKKLDRFSKEISDLKFKVNMQNNEIADLREKLKL